MTNPTHGATVDAVLADLADFDLEQAPTARTLAASALALARALDEEPNAAAARELRLTMSTLVNVASAVGGDAFDAFIAELRSSETDDSPAPQSNARRQRLTSRGPQPRSSFEP